MANLPSGPGKRDDDLDAAGHPVESGRAEDDALRSDDADVASGRDDDLDGDRDGLRADMPAPSLEGSPIGPDDEHGPIHHAEEHDDHAGRSGFAAAALKILIFVLVILGLSLWLVPMVAPHLPAGIARHLMPGQAELDDRLATLAERIETSTAQISADVAAIRQEIGTLSGRLATAEQSAATAQSEAEAARAAAEESAAAAGQTTVAEDVVVRAETAAREAGELAGTATTAATEAGKVASAATRDTASLARRMTEFDARLAALSDQIEAVNDSLVAGAGEGGAAAPELAAAFAGLEAEVDALSARLGEGSDYLTATEAERFATQDDLRSARTALEAEIQQALAALPAAGEIVVDDELDALRKAFDEAVGKLAERVGAAETVAGEAAQSAGSAELAAATAIGKVDDAIRQASLRSAAAALQSQLQNGVPYADALDEAARLLDTAPPAELAEPAATGVATAAELLRGYSRAAREALEADIEAQAGDGLLAQASARVRSVVAGRPASEQAGEAVDAILSRVEARLREGDLAAALVEAETLPEAAQAALGPWLEKLRRHVAAGEAAERYLGPATGSEG